MPAAGHRPDPPSIAHEMAARARLRERFAPLREHLPDQAQIIAGWGGATEPVVTVLCSTYQQGHLLPDALHGFLMQRTDFPFRIVVRDDASTDGTRTVLEDFHRRYPDLIRLLLLDRNTFGQRGRWFREVPELERSEFIAMCEGDDIWIDPAKLQRQIDDLRGRPDHIMSVAGCLRVDIVDGTEEPIGVLDDPVSYRGRLERYHHTSTFVLRSAAYAALVRGVLIPGRVGGDFALLTAAARRGGIAVLPGCVSVYWSNGRGIYSSLSPAQQLRRHCRSRRRVLRALGPPWPWDELWHLARLEERVFRLAVAERSLTTAALRLPFVVVVRSVPLLVRARRAPAALVRRARRWCRSARRSNAPPVERTSDASDAGRPR